ncbi:MAG: hypothetical protein SH850_17220 [Planctomycetaceae bacterium]|nr:hypothetical protein [Planctomycetaceae bacterium]
MLQRRPVVAVPHDALRHLRRHAGAGKLRAQRRPQRVQVDHAPVLVLNHDPRLDPLPLSGADRHRVAVRVEHVHPPSDARPQEVFQPRHVTDRVGPHLRLGKRRRRGQPPLERFSKLGVHGQHVQPLRLAVADRQCSLGEVHVAPRQALQVTLPQSGQRRSEVPRVPPAFPRHCQ